MLIIGHRGASRAAPENTPLAFTTADRMGADGVELDVRLAPGDRLVVFHDPLPAEPTAVAALPDLADVLDACGDRLLVNVEIKGSGGGPSDLDLVERTIAELRRRGAADAHRWLISSFSWETIERCRALAPSVSTAFLVLTADGAVIERTAGAGHAALHPWADSLGGDTVDACHAAGLAVNAWTCNDPDRLVELAALGVDGVCTDVPDLALAALGRDWSAPALSPRWGTPG